jgi:hypothetical protein
MLGLASVYPLFWTAQFLLFFVPETLIAFWLGQPVRVLSVSYLQAMAVVNPHAVFPIHMEAVIFALILSAAIVGMDGDRFLTGALAVVALGQAALLPCLSLALSSPVSAAMAGTGLLAFGIIVLGLFRVLQRTGGLAFLDRLALLSLLTVLPQATLWLVFKFAYPFYDVRLLLLRTIPLYLAAILAAAMPAKISQPVFGGVRWTEIIASTAAASLLIIAISLTSHSLSAALLQANNGPRQSLRNQMLKASISRPANALPEAPMGC